MKLQYKEMLYIRKIAPTLNKQLNSELFTLIIVVSSGVVVVKCVLTFYSADPSSNPTKFVFEKNKMNKTRPGHQTTIPTSISQSQFVECMPKRSLSTISVHTRYCSKCLSLCLYHRRRVFLGAGNRRERYRPL